MAARQKSNRWWVIGSILLVCLVIGVFFYVGGWVSGEEFSPDDFSQRSFSYNVMPLFGITVRGIQYHDSTPVFEQMLLNDGLIVDPKRPIKRWHLTRDSWSNIESPDFDARIVCRLMALRDENNESIWVTWNEDHPDLAKEFWPVIASLARQGLYLDAAEIMLQADKIGEEDRDDFRDIMQKKSTAALNLKASELQDANDLKEAFVVFSRSIEILETDEAKSGRDACLAILGDDAPVYEPVNEAKPSVDSSDDQQ